MSRGRRFPIHTGCGFRTSGAIGLTAMRHTTGRGRSLSRTAMNNIRTSRAVALTAVSRGRRLSRAAVNNVRTAAADHDTDLVTSAADLHNVGDHARLDRIGGRHRRSRMGRSDAVGPTVSGWYGDAAIHLPAAARSAADRRVVPQPGQVGQQRHERGQHDARGGQVQPQRDPAGVVDGCAGHDAHPGNRRARIRSSPARDPDLGQRVWHRWSAIAILCSNTGPVGVFASDAYCARLFWEVSGTPTRGLARSGRTSYSCCLSAREPSSSRHSVAMAATSPATSNRGLSVADAAAAA